MLAWPAKGKLVKLAKACFPGREPNDLICASQVTSAKRPQAVQIGGSGSSRGATASITEREISTGGAGRTPPSVASSVWSGCFTARAATWQGRHCGGGWPSPGGARRSSSSSPGRPPRAEPALPACAAGAAMTAPTRVTTARRPAWTCARKRRGASFGGLGGNLAVDVHGRPCGSRPVGSSRCAAAAFITRTAGRPWCPR